LTGFEPAGKHVIVAALDGTFQRKPFQNVMELIPLSENVVKLNAVCMTCFRDAPFSKRLGTETEVEVSLPPPPSLACAPPSAPSLRKRCPVADGCRQHGQVIGGADKYIAVCRTCYLGNPPQPRTPEAPQVRASLVTLGSACLIMSPGLGAA
jgi:thymidine kinase